MTSLRTIVARFPLLWSGLIFVLASHLVVAQSSTQPRPRSGSLERFDHLSDFTALHESGWRAMSKGWFDTAEREFSAAIKVAKQPTISSPSLLARAYSSLAWALHEQGRTAQAEPLARWALDTRLARFGPNAESVARSLNQMATIYLATNRFASAEPLLRQVIAMDKGTSPVIPQEQAQSETLLGLGLVNERRYAEAEVEFGRAVALRATLQGKQHPETGDELSNLAWARIEQGKLAEARTALDRAIGILGRARGEGDPSFARALEGLARIDTEQNKLADADLKYQRIIAIDEKLGTPQQGNLIETLKRHAALLDRMGRADDAGRVRTRVRASKAPANPGTATKLNIAPPRSPITPSPGRS